MASYSQGVGIVPIERLGEIELRCSQRVARPGVLLEVRLAHVAAHQRVGGIERDGDLDLLAAALEISLVGSSPGPGPAGPEAPPDRARWRIGNPCAPLWRRGGSDRRSRTPRNPCSRWDRERSPRAPGPRASFVRPSDRLSSASRARIRLLSGAQRGCPGRALERSLEIEARLQRIGVGEPGARRTRRRFHGALRGRQGSALVAFDDLDDRAKRERVSVRGLAASTRSTSSSASSTRPTRSAASARAMMQREAGASARFCTRRVRSGVGIGEGRIVEGPLHRIRRSHHHLHRSGSRRYRPRCAGRSRA